MHLNSALNCVAVCMFTSLAENIRKTKLTYQQTFNQTFKIKL